MLSELLFHRSGYAFAHFLRLFGNMLGIGSLMKNASNWEHRTLVFGLTTVVCMIISTLGLIAVGYFSPTCGRTLHYHAVTILILSWCLLITIIFVILDDAVACFPGNSRPIDSADCFVPPGEDTWRCKLWYWFIVSTLLINPLQDV
ncbi:unnamed protein product, partial [Clonostachys rosea]